MRTSFSSMLGLALILWPITNPQAAELQVLAGAGIAAPLKEIAAQFETTSGHKIVIRFGTTPELIKMAAAGAFDLAVVPVDVFRDAPTRTQLIPGATPDVARVGIGVAVRSGAPKPDISTPEALKQTLLKAHAVASIPASATGTLLAGIRITSRQRMPKLLLAIMDRHFAIRKKRGGSGTFSPDADIRQVKHRLVRLTTSSARHCSPIP